MEQNLQNEFRIDLIKEYSKRAWECLALYNYYGQKYQAIEKGIKDMEGRIKDAEKMLSELPIEPGKKMIDEVRKRRDGLRNDISEYKNRIQAVEKPAKAVHDKSVAYQEEASRLLEQIDEFKAFNVKTPEMIAEDKNKKTE